MNSSDVASSHRNRMSCMTITELFLHPDVSAEEQLDVRDVGQGPSLIVSSSNLRS